LPSPIPALCRSVEPNSLVVCVSSEQRDELLATDPDVYYLTEHYEGYDNVLVRLSQINHRSVARFAQDGPQIQNQ
jgi:hypothetical protein